MLNTHHLALILISLLLASCNPEKHEKEPIESSKLFQEVTPQQSGIHFMNEVVDMREFNYLLFQYMYNGGGVAAGDINNDGLVDLYFSSNQKSNKLYLNKGSFVFEDITSSAGVSDIAGWSTGVSFIDINADGFLDIYVCKSAAMNSDNLRRNKLFVNQGNNKFTEEAEKYGIDHPGYSVQSYYLDFDKDGDLDMYLVNHRTDFSDNMKTDKVTESKLSELTSDQLFINEGDRFINVTNQAGVFNHAWGLSASIGDFNDDGWEDIYVCNDFVQGDYLYINNQDGTFNNEINERMDHISFYSMGSDFQDLNNDQKSDLIVLDMVSENHERNIRNMAAMDVEKFRHVQEIGYQRQYMFNMFQLNNGDGTYSEIAQAAGIAKSDWSWAPLIADLNNDGHKDIFITNGIKKDVTDIDYKDQVLRRGIQGDAMGFQEVFSQWPATTLRNYVFMNDQNLQFRNVAKEWGFEKATNSNGCTLADLDNDGDLDVVTNNIDGVASVFENSSKENFIKVVLKGSEQNPMGIGAKVTIEINGHVQSHNHYLSRGFISSVEPGCHFGVGKSKKIDRLKVLWPDGKMSIVSDIIPNQEIIVRHSKSLMIDSTLNQIDPVLEKDLESLNFEHKANKYDDFKEEILLPHKQSTFGGRMAKGDVNGDGLEDIFFGNDAGNSPSLFIQSESGSFEIANQTFWSTQKAFEDMGAVFFDADRDGDQDLYVVSGGNEFSIIDNNLQDRLYLNDGNGIFSRSENHLPEFLNSGCSVSISDYDNDGDLDLFIGGKVVPGKYPVSPSSVLLENTYGVFADVTSKKASHLKQLGMVTDSKFIDIDADGDDDLLIVGEWMPVVVLLNDNGRFQEKIELPNSRGWWYSIDAADFDKDGDIDIVAGNLGKNNKFKASVDRPFHVYANDFDENGSLDIVLTKEQEGSLLPVRGRECSSEQMPFIKEKFPTFTEFGKATLSDIYGQDKLDQAIHLMAETFATSYFENQGGFFNRRDLDIHAQFSPTFGFLVDDYNSDGHLDIIGIGNLYDAEAETVRYDAGRGYMLLGDGRGNFINRTGFGMSVSIDARDIIDVGIGAKSKIVVSGINTPPLIFKEVR